MGFIICPKKIIRFLKNKDNFALRFKQTPEWFLSEAGQVEYRKCKTKADRILFFFEYLDSFQPNTEEYRELQYRLAYVMEDSMLNSSLPFAGFPQILDESKNPIVSMVKKKSFYPSKDCTAELLRHIYALAGKDLDSAAHAIPYEGLSKQNADGSFPELYIIEREIIWAFGSYDSLPDGAFSYSLSDIVRSLGNILETEAKEDV